MVLNKYIVVEIWYPFVGAIILSLLSHKFGFDVLALEDLPTIGITVTSIFIGFISTLAGLLLSSDSKGISRMKQLKKFKLTLKYCWKAVRLSFLFIVLNIFLIIYPDIEYHWVSTVWVFMVSWTYLAIFRSVDVSLGAINHSSEE